MAVTVANVAVPRKAILGYRLLNEESWMNLVKVSPTTKTAGDVSERPTPGLSTHFRLP